MRPAVLTVLLAASVAAAGVGARTAAAAGALSGDRDGGHVMRALEGGLPPAGAPRVEETCGQGGAAWLGLGAYVPPTKSSLARRRATRAPGRRALSGSPGRPGHSRSTARAPPLD